VTHPLNPPPLIKGRGEFLRRGAPPLLNTQVNINVMWYNVSMEVGDWITAASAVGTLALAGVAFWTIWRERAFRVKQKKLSLLNEVYGWAEEGYRFFFEIMFFNEEVERAVSALDNYRFEKPDKDGEEFTYLHSANMCRANFSRLSSLIRIMRIDLER